MPDIWVSKSLVPSGGAEPNHTTAGKTGPLLIIQYSEPSLDLFILYIVGSIFKSRRKSLFNYIKLFAFYKSFHAVHSSLKGLSHEIDFKNFDQNLKNLA
jgi:hypothetical protein